MEADDIGDINLPAAPLLPEHDSSQINISDVIAAIQTADPLSTLGMFATNPTDGGREGDVTKDPPTCSPMVEPFQHQQCHQSMSAVVPSNQQQQQYTANNIRRTAYVKITEQPAGKALRFRYECEGRSAGSIPGVNSTPENRTFPSIQVVGYKGRAVVVVSCVTKDPPYRPHPHNLVGREGCRRGVCTVEINSETMSVVFSNLGIQCVKKKDIESALKVREEIRVDPFRTGFAHRCQATGIDLNAVRLCFQVFLESDLKGKFTVPLPPVVSDPIYDKKAMSELVICKLSDCSCTVAGGKEIILLCEKVARDDIAVRFFEEKEGKIRWQAYGDFQHTNVHKQVAISFRTPKYERLNVHQIVSVYIQLQRPSDGATSEALPFDYLPLDSDLEGIRNKRRKISGNPRAHLITHLNEQQQQQQQQNPQMMQPHPSIPTADARQQPSIAFAGMMGEAIKTEPQDHSPNPYFGNTSQYRAPQASPSPQPLSPASNYTQANTPSPLMGAAGPLVSPNDQLIRDNVSPMNISYGAGLTPYAAHQYSIGGIDNYQQLNQTTHINPIPWNISASTAKQVFNNIENFSVCNTLSNPNPTNSHGQGLPQQNEILNLNEQNIPANLSSLLLNLDNHQVINSADLSQLSLSWLDNQNNDSSSQKLDCKKEERQKMETEQENMMDSFTRLTTATMNELVDLGQMYNNQNNC